MIFLVEITKRFHFIILRAETCIKMRTEHETKSAMDQTLFLNCGVKDKITSKNLKGFWYIFTLKGYFAVIKCNY